MLTRILNSFKVLKCRFSRVLLFVCTTLLCGTYCMGDEVTITGEGGKFLLTLTGLSGYDSAKAKEVSSMGMFGDYINGLSSEKVVDRRGNYGVDNVSIDAHEAIVVTVTELNLAGSESLVLQGAGSRQYTKDDSSDLLVYDFSANHVVISEFDRKGAGSNKFTVKDIVLEKGDVILFAAGVSGKPSWRLSDIKTEIVGSSTVAPKKDVGADVVAPGNASSKEYSFIGIDGKSHMIKAFFPTKKSAKAPCAVFFHGGGWSGGSYRQFESICKYLASRGMVSITADYALTSKSARASLPAGQSRKRNCVIDGKSVIRWVKKNSNLLGIDPNRIVAGGGSAGGQISTLAMMDDEYNNPSDDLTISTEVQALLLFCPAFVIENEPSDVNVFKHVDKSFPPTLFLVGETDGWKKASDVLAKKLKAKGADVENWMAPGKGHMFFLRGEFSNICMKKMDSFLVERGFLRGSSSLNDAASGEKLVPVK